ncbi:hypothetical protein [Epibacterium ulvae]|uniref:hypothetical protein n=1 Tax=Epibacterium ulvae TaxID=1156985 RepID=UPI00249177C4|nr:hypothetical protein [Epibacterium ulvae]
MAVKYYAQIDFDLFSNPKYRALSSNDIRYIYLAAHCSKLSNYIGLFRYPVDIWSYDASAKPLEIEAAISELQRCDLIEYDFEYQTLRLVGWFSSLNAPNNGNQMKGHIKSFSGLPTCPPEMFCRAVSEFTVASFKQALSWEDLSPEHKKVHDAFRTFLKAQFFKYGDDFNLILMDEINKRGRVTFGAIQSCYQMLPSEGLHSVQPFRKGIETLSKQEKRKEEKTINQKTINVSPPRNSSVTDKPSSSALNSKIAKQARKELI